MDTKRKKVIISVIVVISLVLSSFITTCVYLYITESKNSETLMIEELFDSEQIKKLKSSHLKYKTECTYDDGTSRESNRMSQHTDFNID